MDAKRQEQQRVGYIVSQGAQLAQRGAVPCGMSDILRGPTDMPGGTTGATYLAEIRTEGKRTRETECDAYGENLVKATLPGGGWVYHHNGINL